MKYENKYRCNFGKVKRYGCKNGLFGCISDKLMFLLDVKMTVLDVLMTSLILLDVKISAGNSFLPLIHPLCKSASCKNDCIPKRHVNVKNLYLTTNKAMCYNLQK